MNKIEQMVKEMCPGGVKYRKIQEVCAVQRGKRLTKRDLLSDGLYCVFHGGIEPIGKFNHFNRESNTVMIINVGASAGTVGFSKDRFWSSDGNYCLSHNEELNNRFVFYYLQQNEMFFKRKIRYAGIPTLDASVINEFTIPLPPLPIQEAIVEFLDKFESLQQGLQDELQARKSQYEYYRNKLLTQFPNNVQVKEFTLGEICTLGTGSHNTQDGLIQGKYPFYTRGTDISRLNSYDFDEEAIVTAGDGVGVGKVMHFVSGKYALHQRAYRIVPNTEILIPKYLYYYMLVTFLKYINTNSVSSSVSSLRKPMLLKYPIKIPDIQEQQKIVTILDHFETLVNDQEKGIPAEISAVKKQYEYYRNKLLTFSTQNYKE